MTMHPILVTASHSSIGLTVLQSLGRKGVRCVGISNEPGGVGLYSRYLYRGHILPYDTNRAGDFVAGLDRIAREHQASGILPVVEHEVLAVYQHRERLSPDVRILAPPEPAMRIAVDKTATLARAATLGIRIPAGDVIRSREDALRAAEEFPFPAVLKVAGLIRGTLPPEWEFKYRYFENRDEWAAFIRGAPDCPQEYLLQEFIPGRYTGIGIAMQAGRAVAAFQWLALREYEAGLGGLRISQPLDPTLFDQAQRLCADIGYEGVCEVEFRGADPPALMEINPRLWGGASFPVACGVDFPFIAYQIYSGIPVEPRFEYRAGLLGRNLPGDLKWFLKGFLLGSYKQAIPSIRVSRGRVLRDFVSSLGKARVHDLESWDDPMPAVGHYVRKLTRLRLPTK